MPFNDTFSGVGMHLTERIGFGGPGRFCEDVEPLTVGVDPVNAHFLCGGDRSYWGGFGVRCDFREVGPIGIECVDRCDWDRLRWGCGCPVVNSAFLI